MWSDRQVVILMPLVAPTDQLKMSWYQLGPGVAIKDEHALLKLGLLTELFFHYRLGVGDSDCVRKEMP